jgi:hypothetical protein
MEFNLKRSILLLSCLISVVCAAPAFSVCFVTISATGIYSDKSESCLQYDDAEAEERATEDATNQCGDSTNDGWIVQSSAFTIIHSCEAGIALSKATASFQCCGEW